MDSRKMIGPLYNAALVLSLVACGPSSGGRQPEARMGGGEPAAQTGGDAAQQPAADTGSTGGVGAMGGMMGRGRMPMMGGMMSEPADTAAAPTAATRQSSAPGCPDVSRALVDTGREIFTGAGNCYACHGSDARGTPVAPNLTDGQWLDVDGSYAAIADLVRSGVPHPRRFPAPMPAEGGAQLSREQVCAVASYVYGLQR